MARKYIDNIEIENAHIIRKNFAGVETKYNRAGNRNFCVVIDDPEMAQKLMDDGWNLKPLTKRDEDDIQAYSLEVAVKFGNLPPDIFMVTNKAKVPLNEESVGTLDSARIRNIDLIINPSFWEVNGKQGVKAYLLEMWVTLEESRFASKYENLGEE